jgi:hypothetical protein
VIEDSHFDEREGLANAACHVLVGRARLGVSGRVVMIQDHPGGSVLEDRGDDLPDVDGGAVDRAAEEILHGDESMSIIQMEQSEVSWSRAPKWIRKNSAV